MPTQPAFCLPRADSLTLPGVSHRVCVAADIELTTPDDDYDLSVCGTASASCPEWCVKKGKGWSKKNPFHAAKECDAYRSGDCCTTKNKKKPAPCGNLKSADEARETKLTKTLAKLESRINALMPR